MKRSAIQRMDANLLYSIVNMKLRNDYADLDDLASSMDIDRAELETRLGEAGYRYSAEVNQFRKSG